MPKKKKRRGHTGSKRRAHRMGALSLKPHDAENTAMTLGGAIIGGAMVKLAEKALTKPDATVTIKPEMLDLVGGVLGAGGAFFIAHPFIRGIAIGVAVQSASNYLQSSGVLNGVAQVGRLPGMPVPNFTNSPRLNGPQPNAIVQFNSPQTVGSTTPQTVGRVGVRKFAGVMN